MQSFLVRAAMVGCLRAQRDVEVEDAFPAQAAAVGRSGMRMRAREKEKGMYRIDVLATRRYSIGGFKRIVNCAMRPFF